ncbi:unnamed protein product, partial [Hydatigera taeniaeformis]|uniref:Thioredoxin domain-containing protein n=1 Tax=Hydatigena taeniaeformis TaxID=6205 RepID=A0A0R3X2E8_HYDTA
YAPWCPACNLVAVEWRRFAELAPHHDVKVAQLDCSAESAVAMIFTITSLPTIFHVKDGVFRIVKGKRKTEQLLDFIKNREFELIEPTTWSIPPNAFYMSAVVRFLDLCLSITVRVIAASGFGTLIDLKAHRMMIGYGVPASLSIILVGTGVLASGAAIGMLILCVCEYFCPPRPQILNVVGMEGDPPQPIVTKETACRISLSVSFSLKGTSSLRLPKIRFELPNLCTALNSSFDVITAQIPIVIGASKDMEQDSVLDDSEDSSWTEVKAPDAKDCGQTDEPLVLHRRNIGK